ncbi:LacI family transcriptional regulator [Emticicia aquatilis]|uniref:LacI family transcriptional regulator n=1 Tax=Emticicia aquatilis TaxID=1537369 RepID=A0A916YM82_9BACT|nr:LacI family transcriptional regulator [Emticicia aquatilis]
MLKSNQPQPTKSNNPITIVDVANFLGVSISTVSRALNNKSDINQKTKDAIIQAAIDLDYKPNFLAQSLNKGSTHTIGVIVPDVGHPFFASVLAGIQQVANNTGYRIIVCHSNESYRIEVLNTETLMACRVDGILISHSKETTEFDHIKKITEKGIPVVQYDRVNSELNTSNIIHQDFKGAFNLVEHLISQGCRRIGVMSGPKEMQICKTRIEGYKAALQKHGIEINNDYIVHSNISYGEGEQILNYFIGLENPPDGIFAIVNRNAIEMMKAAKEKGIKIPDELAFAGFGDDILAQYFEPPLTVYNHFPTRIGEIAIRMLIENINNKSNFNPYSKIVEGELIIRKSSLKKGSCL